MLPRLINQAVGDALSDLLLVDAILHLRGWTLFDWNGLYRDMPSRQSKIQVKDRSVIVTNDNETKAVSPLSLQPAMDRAMSAAAAATAATSATEQRPRVFVRPSGTENVVRVYAEAATQKDADALALEASLLIYSLCGGVGDEPKLHHSSNL